MQSVSSRTKVDVIGGACGGCLVGYAFAFAAHPETIYLGQVVILFVVGALILGKVWLRAGKERKRETYALRIF